MIYKRKLFFLKKLNNVVTDDVYYCQRGDPSTQKAVFSAYSILSLTMWRWSCLNRLTCGNIKTSSLSSAGWHIICAYFRFSTPGDVPCLKLVMQLGMTKLDDWTYPSGFNSWALGFQAHITSPGLCSSGDWTQLSHTVVPFCSYPALWWQGILVPLLPGTEVLEPVMLLPTCASSHRFLSLSASALHL